METKETCLDSVLEDIGNFGKYQKKIVILIFIASMICYFPIIVWVFESKEVKYRCQIFENESVAPEYMPNWWTEAIPSIDNKPVNCEVYKCIIDDSKPLTCSGFDKNKTERCDQFIYETNEISILHDFNLQCDNNLWKLTMVGTINSIGALVGLPVFGFFSDKFGRKTTLILSIMLNALSGLIRSFSTSYTFFLFMEFTDAFFRSGSYPTCFIMGAEFVGPNKRVLMSVLVNIATALGGVIVASVAWAVSSWRTLVQILYGSSFIILLYYWLLPESMRWLITKGRRADVTRLLQNIAKENGTALSEEQLKSLFNTKSSLTNSQKSSIYQLFQSPILRKRFIYCCICWTFCLFLYYGFTMNAVTLSSNSYLDFILSMLVEVPGNVIAHFLTNKIGKRYCFSLAFLICGISSITFTFIPEDLSLLRLLVYLLGKCGASISMTAIYTLTSDIFPTTLRSSLLSVCAVFGKLGVIMASQSPILKLYWKPLQLLLFGLAAIAGSLLALLFPETLHTTLPNTIEEAENIGKKINVKNELLMEHSA